VVPFLMKAPDNLVQPFQVESMAAQGRLVRLGSALDEILSAHNYPASVARLLGEFIVLGAILSGTLKREGVLTVQAYGEEAIRLLVVDLTHDGNIRGYARFDEAQIEKLTGQGVTKETPEITDLFGTGRLVFNLTYGDAARPYQGIVPLEGRNLAECAETYFRQSVQSAATFMVAVERVRGAWRGGGLMLQHLAKQGYQPQSGENDVDNSAEAWQRAKTMMRSTTEEERLSVELHPHDLLYRLFNEDGVRVFPYELLRMNCRCSKDRVEEVLNSFPNTELEKMIVEDNIVVNCEFCNQEYRFGPDEIGLVSP